LPLPDNVGNISQENRLLQDEICYDIVDMTAAAIENIARLNENKKSVHNAILNSVMNDEAQFFCLWIWKNWENILMDYLAQFCKE
jgi:hypothetical protein